jgi:hypothetical protein
MPNAYNANPPQGAGSSGVFVRSERTDRNRKRVTEGHWEANMTAPSIAAYALDALGPANIATNLEATRAAGWTTILLGLFHIGYPPDQAEAEIFFNSTSIIKGGKDAGMFNAGFDPTWPQQIAALKKNSPITRIHASFGGGPPVVDFTTIKKIYEANNNSFKGTALETNLQLISDTFKEIDGIKPIDGIDMDCEDVYDPASFVAFCEMAIGMGFNLSFCPFKCKGFWTGALATLENSHPGRVTFWNLQCYSGGRCNVPQSWADAIKQTLPDFDTDGYILAGDWCRFLDQLDANPADWIWVGDCPAAMERKFAPFKAPPDAPKGQRPIGGGFVWTLDNIMGYAASQKQKPDPEPCSDYVAAIKAGLGN